MKIQNFDPGQGSWPAKALDKRTCELPFLYYKWLDNERHSFNASYGLS